MKSRSVLAMAAVAVAAVVACAVAQNAGMRVVISNSGLAQFSAAALPIINKALNVVIVPPPPPMQVSVPIMGAVTFTIEDFIIAGFDLPVANFAFTSPSSLYAVLADLTFALRIDYKWRQNDWPNIEGSGAITAVPQGGNIGVIALVTEQNGHAVLTPADVSVQFQSFNINFEGAADWILNLFASLFEGDIKNMIDNAVQTELTNIFSTNLNQILADIPTSMEVGDGGGLLIVDTAITDITMGGDYMSLGLEFTVDNGITKAVCPYTPVAMPVNTPGYGENMLQLLLAESFINCAAWTASNNGVFSQTITPANEPPNAILKLNTTSWALLIPELAQMYPDMAMQLQVSPVSPPLVEISTAGVKSAVPMNFNFGVMKGSTVIPVFDLTATFTLGFDVSIVASANTPILHFNATILDLQLDVVSSSVGTINVTPIQGLLNTVLPFFRSLINDVIAKGIPIPLSPGVNVLQPAIVFADQFLAIAANFQFA